MSRPTLSIHEVFAHQKRDLLSHLLNKLGENERALVFIRSRNDLHDIKAELNTQDLPLDSISGSKKPELRERALRELVSGHIKILLATEAVLRESNLDGITHIIQFDTPELDQDYLARLASQIDKIITFISPSDQPRLEKLRTLTELEILTEIAPDFPYDKYSQQVKSAPIKGHVANKSKSKPLQNKKPKLKNKGPRRKTGRTRKR